MSCHIVRFMGLQQYHGLKTDLSSLQAERRNLFWMLYAMDKQRVYLTGQPCDLYLFDSDMQQLKCDGPTPIQKFFLAHVHMMSLWEEVYISLYSLRASRKGASYRQEQVMRLSSLLRNWGFQHKQALGNPTQIENSLEASLRRELRYCFHVGQILIHRCHEQESSRQQRVGNARAALHIIKSLYEDNHSISGVAVLGR